MKRALQVALSLSVTTFFLWLLLARLDAGRLIDALGRTATLPLFVGLCLLTLDFGVRLLRWWWMLRLVGADVGLKECASPFFSGIALNNVLPFRLGDAARTFAFGKQLGVGSGRLFGTLVVERLLDLLALLALLFLGMSGADESSLPPGLAQFAAISAGGGVAALFAFTLAAPHILVRLPDLQRPHSGKWCARIGRQAGEVLTVLATLHTPRAALQLVALSFGAWLLEAGVFAAVARATGSGAPLAGSLFAMAAGTLATLLPSAPGYVGTFDFFAMAGWAAHGLGPESATANALVVHLVLWLPLTIVGLAMLASPGGRNARQHALEAGRPKALTAKRNH